MPGKAPYPGPSFYDPNQVASLNNCQAREKRNLKVGNRQKVKEESKQANSRVI